jgi:hypothetical protein
MVMKRDLKLTTSLVLSNLLAAFVTWKGLHVLFPVPASPPTNIHQHGDGSSRYTESRATQECCVCKSGDVASIFECPSRPASINIEAEGLTKFAVSSKLCTLVEITSDGFLKPVGRSYNGINWEASAGDYATLEFDCVASYCAVDLPSGRKYQLTTFANASYSRADSVARFLEQATFGPTRADIQSLDDGSSSLRSAYAEWIRNQQQSVSLTSHREYFRRRLNARYPVATQLGAVTHPCQKGTRYRRFSFSAKDSDKILVIETSAVNPIKKILSIDGFVRTVVDGPVVTTLRDGTLFEIPDDR